MKEDLIFFYLRNGITVADRKRSELGDYAHIAHISRQRKITWYKSRKTEKSWELSSKAKLEIERFAREDNLNESVTQPYPVLEPVISINKEKTTNEPVLSNDIEGRPSFFDIVLCDECNKFPYSEEKEKLLGLEEYDYCRCEEEYEDDDEYWEDDEFGVVHEEKEEEKYYGEYRYTELLIKFSKITLDNNKVITNKQLSQEDLNDLQDTKMELYNFLQMQFPYKNIPLKGTFETLAAIYETNGTLTKKENTLVWTIDKENLSNDLSKAISSFEEYLREEIRPLLYQMGTILVENKTDVDFDSNEDFRIRQVFNTALKEILNKAKIRNQTLKASFKLSSYNWIAGIRRVGLNGNKKLIGDFLAKLEPTQYCIIKQHSNNPDYPISLFLYYSTLENIRLSGWHEGVGRIEIESIPLSENKEITEKYLKHLVSIIETCKDSKDDYYSSIWKYHVGLFIRGNRVELSKHFLRNGKPAIESMTKLGLEVIEDDYKGIKIAGDNTRYSLVISGMQRTPNTSEYHYPYNWKTDNADTSIKFLTAIRESANIDKDFGRLRLPVIAYDNIRGSETGEISIPSDGHPELHQHFLISSDLSLSLPMPIISLDSVTNLLDDIQYES